MKVVVAHNRYSSRQPSGENAVVDAELRWLAEVGIDVVPFLRSSDEIAALSLAERALLPVSPIYARQAQHALGALLDKERPDVVHLHNPYPLLSPWVVRTATVRNVPVVQTVHNFRHACVSGVFFRDGRSCRDCLGWSWPMPAVRHGCYRGSRAQSAVMATALAVHRTTWPEVARFLALTPEIEGFLRTIGVPATKIVVKPNAVSDPGPPTPPGDGFLFAGRLSPEKGVGLLLDAWARRPAGVLRIAGDGPLRSTVAMAGSTVEYLGPLDRAGVREAMRRVAVVVVPSLWDEVCPMVAIEAMANGRPVLATSRGGLPWLIGDAGWLVEPTVDALVAGFVRARAEAAGLAEAARRRYETRFHPGVVTPQLVAAYASVAR